MSNNTKRYVIIAVCCIWFASLLFSCNKKECNHIWQQNGYCSLCGETNENIVQYNDLTEYYDSEINEESKNYNKLVSMRYALEKERQDTIDYYDGLIEEQRKKILGASIPSDISEAYKSELRNNMERLFSETKLEFEKRKASKVAEYDKAIEEVFMREAISWDRLEKLEKEKQEKLSAIPLPYSFRR